MNKRVLLMGASRALYFIDQVKTKKERQMKGESYFVDTLWLSHKRLPSHKGIAIFHKSKPFAFVFSPVSTSFLTHKISAYFLLGKRYLFF